MARFAKPPIAILTDFGYRDHYAGVMKGVIASIAPNAAIIDITHGVPPQSIMSGAIALAQSWKFFPKKTVFLAVVDPGVGTTRLPIAVETKSGASFVGPDNGLLWLAANDAGIKRIHQLRSKRYRLSAQSSTFHGRDIFAPAAAHIWNGVAPSLLGPRLRQFQGLAVTPPKQESRGVSGFVIYVDGFGNLVTNIDRKTVTELQASFPHNQLLVRIDGGARMEVRETYAEAAKGAPLATFGSFELLEIAIRDGNAAEKFSIREGGAVRILAGR
jgi:S-adenosyl-L-methionine hydrolase (adenosine-forming)